VRVLVVDDQRPFRTAAAAVLRRTPGFVLVGEASTAQEALDLVPELGPDLVLLDINLPGMNGIEAARRLAALAPSVTVFLCSTYRRSDLPAEVASSPAAAYVPKEELTGALLRELWDQAHAGGTTVRT
jgi:pilus assembly protein CpaE